MCRLLEEPLVSGNDPFWSSGKRRPPFRRLPFLSTGSEDAIIPVAIRARGGGGGGGGGGAYFAGAGGGAGEDLAALQHQRDGLHLDRRRLGVALGPQVGHQFRPHAQRLAPLLETGKKKKRTAIRYHSRIRLYHPRIYHPAVYIGHFRPEPNFYIIKPSGYIIQPSSYIGHFEIALNCRCGCLRDTLPGSHSHTCLQT